MTCLFVLDAKNLKKAMLLLLVAITLHPYLSQGLSLTFLLHYRQLKTNL